MTPSWLAAVTLHSGVSAQDIASDRGMRMMETVAAGAVGSAVSPLAWARALARVWAAEERPLTVERWQELALVEACLLGEASGLRGVETLLLDVVTVHTRGSRHGAAMVEDAAQRVRQKLLVDAPDAPARLRQFEGRGPLRAFLRTTLVREVSTLARQVRRELPLDEQDPAAPQAVGELALLKHAYGPPASQAFKDAFAALPDDQQRLLHQVYAHGMTVDDLAKVHQVHRATCARWVARARGDLADATRRLVQVRLGLACGEADSLLGALQSSLSVSLGWGGGIGPKRALDP